MLGAVGVLVLVAAGLIGYVIGNSGNENAVTSSVPGMMSGTHQQSQNLSVQSIGDPQRGAQLFSSMGYRPALAETEALIAQTTALAS